MRESEGDEGILEGDNLGYLLSSAFPFAMDPPVETEFYDRAASFASTPLLGHAFRLYAASPDFGPLSDHFSVQEGLSVLVLPDGSGRLLVSTRSKDRSTVRHATMPLHLIGDGDYENQGVLPIELVKFRDHCVIYGETGPSSGRSEAHKIVNEFACEILDEDGGDGGGSWNLKLSPCQGGHKFRYNDEEDGELQTILPSDIMMTTPNCDELGHYFFRPTAAIVSSTKIDDVLAEEMAAWDDILIGPKLSLGDRVLIRKAFRSGNEDGGLLKKGISGLVKDVDEDGDAEVDFGPNGTHFVLSGCFRCLCVK